MTLLSRSSTPLMNSTTESTGSKAPAKPPRGKSVRVEELVHNAFAGRPVFILGTGPSLKEQNLHPLVDHWTFGTGELILWDGLPFVPSLYGIDEPRAQEDGLWEALRVAGVHGFSTPPPPIHGFFKVDEVHGYWVPDHLMQVRGASGIKTAKWLRRTEIHQGIIGGFNEELNPVPGQHGVSSLRCAVQPAIWLGFDPIYLLGHDFSKGYVVGEDERQGQYWPEGKGFWQILKALSRVRYELEARGRSIINLSPGSYENVLEKGHLEAVV